MLLKRFEVEILKEAFEFIASQDLKTRQKIFDVLNRSRFQLNPKLFKKIDSEIWEFRILSKGKQVRILAFWDKTNKSETLVLATNGFVKQKSKIPRKEIGRAQKIRSQYFKNKKDEKV